ncbi:MAG: TonB family protein [Candidatus Rokubacteria bacterium]|nr:TonB family protein [Candidatus Rokubacteria bacterium]
MPLFWTPQHEAPPDSGRFAQRSRLVRFVGVSVAVHVLAVVATPWLSAMMPARGEPAIIRTVDFVVPDTPPARQTPKPGAPLGDRDERAGRPPVRATREGGRPGAPRTPAPAPKKAPAAVAKTEAPAPPPREAPKPELPAAPPRVVAKAETPRPAPAPVPAATPAEDPRLAAATPKALGNMTARNRGPVAIGAPSGVGGSPGASPSPGAIASVPPAVAGGGAAGTAPVAPVALPPGLTGLGGSGSGSGAGGRGGSGGGDGTGQADMRDPDFSEYFRLIEKRVRSAWKFPDSLGGTTQTVKIGFALGPEGSLRDVRVVSSSSGTLNDSALAAMKRAAPFPPLPSKFRMLAGQPLVMSFTVTIQ